MIVPRVYYADFERMGWGVYEGKYKQKVQKRRKNGDIYVSIDPEGQYQIAPIMSYIRGNWVQMGLQVAPDTPPPPLASLMSWINLKCALRE